ncbi:MAG TPA: type II toxin-antitoxin system RelE/ParE family toxin [Clostridia bacterium]|nr:type II toxin-antitoxin system RelE/ParE family toxin [Clostridia bacterium]
MSKFKLFFYSSRNSNPIDEFISTLTAETKAKIFKSLDLIEKYGPMIGMPHVKKIDKMLFELRIKGKEEIRLFFTCSRQKIFFLHIFKKKTRKIPLKELNVARKRLTEDWTQRS